MNKLKNKKINQSKSVLSAIKLINKNREGLCYIVDNSNKLVGVLTDGDIRRAIISKKDLNKPIKNILKKNFISLHYKTEKNKILKFFNANIKHIPLVNSSGKLVGSISKENVNISLAKPELNGNELKYVNNCINIGWISSAGKYVRNFEKKFSNFTKIKNCLAVSSGTTALHLALETLGISKGDEVIVPNLTFASPVNMIIKSGAKPIFIDVNEKTYCIDEKEIEKKINKKTKALIVVHLFGHPANLKKIKKITDKHKLYLIEDCAEALGSYYEHKHVGNVGDASTFSFYGNKLITTGEGGMLCFKKKKLMQKAEILRDHGMSKSKRYWHNEVGFNYRLTNIQSAIGVAQLEKINFLLKSKKRLAKNYEKNLKKLNFLDLPGDYGQVKNSYWLYTIKLKKNLKKYKNTMIKEMNEKRIEARPIFFPLNTMPIYKKYINKNEKFNTSKDLYERSISLPSAYDVDEKKIKEVSKFLRSFVHQINFKKKYL